MIILLIGDVSATASFSRVVSGLNETISLGKKQYCGISYIYLDLSHTKPPTY